MLGKTGRKEVRKWRAGDDVGQKKGKKSTTVRFRDGEAEAQLRKTSGLIGDVPHPTT